MSRRETVERAAKQWAEELTDESGRNRLLYYKELKAGTLNLDHARVTVLKRLLGGRKVRAQQLFPDERSVDAVGRIRAVNRMATTNFEEKGINTLFLGWGMATWTPVSSSATPAAPILLCPVDLERTGAAELDFNMQLSGDWVLNDALLQHLDNEFKVDVSGESLMDPYGDGEQISEEEEKAIFAELSLRAERVPDFEISEHIVLGNFMFKKMPMVKDINNNLGALAQHDLIAAIAGDNEAAQAVRANHASAVAKSLPDRTPPKSEFLVLDADASQNAAINAALAGESFVLQGPPGTGKSQTISNLIAAMMAHGKSVLFVAEKRAAIDAVAKRLTKVGLDRFVMDLHGGVASRRELARQLNQSLIGIGQIPPTEHKELHRRLQKSRQELSGFAEALHEQREPWGMSYFDVQSQLLLIRTSESSVGDRPQAPTRFSSFALSKLNQASAQRVRSDLRDWADLSEPLRSGRSPWAGVHITTDEEVRSALSACIGLAGEFTSSWQTQQKLLSEDLGFDKPRSSAEWVQVIAEVPEMARGVSNAEAVLTLEVFNQDLDKLIQDMAPATRSGLGKLSEDLGFDKPRSSAEWVQVIAEVPEMARGVSNAEAVLTLEVFNQDLDKLIQDMAPATRSGLGKLSEDLGFDKPRSSAEWVQVIAEVPEMARGVSNAEAVLTLEVFNQDLDKLIQDMAPATRSGLGKLSEDLGFDKPRSSAEWAQVIAEVPEMARGVSNAEAVLTLEVFNQDLDKLIQDMAPATRSGLGKLSEDLGFDKPRSSAEWAQVIAEVPEMARGVSNAEAVLTLEVFNQDLDKLIQDMAPATRSAPSQLFNKLFNKRYKSALAQLKNLKPGLTEIKAQTLFDEVNAARTLTQRWAELGCPGSPQVLANTESTPEEIAELAQRYESALAQLKNLKPGLTEIKAQTLFDEVNAARTLTQRWAELGCPGSPQVLANTESTPEEIAELAQRYESALAQLKNLKPGLTEIKAQTLFDEVNAARTLTQRWAELGCPGSPQVLANTESTPEEIAELAQRYESALAQLKNLKPGLTEIKAQTLFDEVNAARTLTQRWAELGCPGSPQVLANTESTPEEIAELAQRYESALAQLKNLKPGLTEIKAQTLFDEVNAARTLTQRWAELGCPGSPQVLASADAAFEAFERMKCALDNLSSLLPESNFAERTAGEVSRISQELLSDQQTLFSLPQLAEVEQRLRDAHVGPLIDKVGNNTLSAHTLESAFDHSWLQSIQWELSRGDNRLSGFLGTRQSRYVDEFKRDDTEHLQGTSDRVARNIAEHAVTALNRFPQEDQLIRREASKKTRHLPLRRLFEQAPRALTSIRPCWAMSPLDVAQTLPPRPLFDLVVFDEASQVLPCDAIPALLRGTRAMVAGDSRQLPPTTFFDSSGGDDDLDEDEEAMSDYESILDVMDARLSRRPLAWHYRSQDERLIAYSNQQIYDGNLTTFPGADSDKCLTWVMVPHRMGMATEKGSNSDEVLRVVDLMIDHAQQRPAESLGVIAMGLHHANRIEESLRRRVEEENSPELEEFFKESHEERAFVKNLERVQGDERDAIILSIGYGKNADGRMLYRFGPLSLEGGERRLNVAITRARKRMTLVSSFEYGDMDPDRTRSTGPKMLRGFLKFAQSGGTELDGSDQNTSLNPFEIDVLDKLTAAGLAVVPQYGSSDYRIDFAVRHPTKPGQFVLAVEADGASYHSSPTVRDRDRLRQEHLERLGWRFYRIWSTDWFNNHRREVDRVRAAYERAVKDTGSGQSSPSKATDLYDEPPRSPERIRVNDLPPRDQRPRVPRYASIQDYEQQELIQLATWILSDGLLRTNEQLFDELFEELGFGRRGHKIVNTLNAAIASAKRLPH